MNAALPPSITIAGCETEAVTVIGGSLASGVVLLCDHASNRLPPEYGTLGLPATVVGVLPEDHDTHLLWRRELQCAQGMRREHNRACVQPLIQKAQQFAPHRLAKKCLHQSLPSSRNRPTARIGA